MGDLLGINFDQAGDIVNQISGQAKQCEDLTQKIRSSMGITLTPGVFEGAGAEAFSQFILTKYLPDVAALIAAIFGLSTGFSGGMDIFQKADSSALGQVSGIAESFGFM